MINIRWPDDSSDDDDGEETWWRRGICELWPVTSLPMTSLGCIRPGWSAAGGMFTLVALCRQ